MWRGRVAQALVVVWLVGPLPAWAPASIQAEEVVSEARAQDGASRASRKKRRLERRRRQRLRARRAKQRKQRQRRRRRMANYRRMRARWHRPAPRHAVRAFKRAERPPLELRRVGDGPTVRLVPVDDEGHFDAEALAEAASLFAWPEPPGAVQVHPRLLALVYQACKHFEAPFVHVISGYRDTRATSRHAQGRAIDLVVPGVSSQRLARFFSKQGFVGVGMYPTSGFVHLDVRDRSYFWIDSSGPDRPQRRRTVLKDRAYKADRRARARGVEPVPDADVTGDEASAERSAGDGDGPG